jgi:hypothetical protein
VRFVTVLVVLWSSVASADSWVAVLDEGLVFYRVADSGTKRVRKHPLPPDKSPSGMAWVDARTLVLWSWDAGNAELRWFVDTVEDVSRRRVIRHHVRTLIVTTTGQLWVEIWGSANRHHYLRVDAPDQRQHPPRDIAPWQMVFSDFSAPYAMLPSTPSPDNHSAFIQRGIDDANRLVCKDSNNVKTWPHESDPMYPDFSPERVRWISKSIPLALVDGIGGGFYPSRTEVPLLGCESVAAFRYIAPERWAIALPRTRKDGGALLEWRIYHRSKRLMTITTAHAPNVFLPAPTQ